LSVLLLSLACAAAASAQAGAPAPQTPPAPASECTPEKPGEARHYKAVRVEPRLGEKISGYPKWKNELLMTASGGLDPSYEVSHGGVHYTVATDQDRKVIEYVSTGDPAFRTPEGLAAGDTLERVLAAAAGAAVARERGWAFHVRLPSGWSAAFTQGRSMTEGELPSSARVCFFFKRQH
jgi:hypothetical protein